MISMQVGELMHGSYNCKAVQTSVRKQVANHNWMCTDESGLREDAEVQKKEGISQQGSPKGSMKQIYRTTDNNYQVQAWCKHRQQDTQFKYKKKDTDMAGIRQKVYTPSLSQSQSLLEVSIF